MMTNKKLIEEWFKKRFKKEPIEDKAYFNEWVLRFKNGSPESYMDSESLRIWKKLTDRNKPIEQKFIGDRIKKLCFEYSKEYYGQDDLRTALICAIQSLGLTKNETIGILNEEINEDYLYEVIKDK